MPKIESVLDSFGCREWLAVDDGTVIEIVGGHFGETGTVTIYQAVMKEVVAVDILRFLLEKTEDFTSLDDCPLLMELDSEEVQNGDVNYWEDVAQTIVGLGYFGYREAVKDYCESGK